MLLLFTFSEILFSFIGFAPAVFANTHGGVHIHLRNGENIEDCEAAQPPDYCMELKPWYCNQHYDQYEEIEDQAERLQEDTAWPGQREEYSDILLR